MTINSPDGYLYLRSRPSMNSTILATGYNDEWVEILEEGANWSQVLFKGQVGYMGAKFLENHRNY
jgi:uncharacterized protein YgiM (DUF1202 family)